MLQFDCMYVLLNPFPIQFLSLFAYFLLRVITGFILLSLSQKHFKARRNAAYTFPLPLIPFPAWQLTILAALEAVAGILFIVGAYTQYVALGAMAYCLFCIIKYRKIALPHFPPRIFFVLLFGVALSLFITGAGALAVDLPI
jgi:uncharacterized membrane protein YphA (DoxX/SURF4 family)